VLKSLPLSARQVYHAGVSYNVSYALLNAADYGVAQQRERVFIVGSRSDLGLRWSFPQPTHSEERLLWEMFVNGCYWQRHQLTAPRLERGSVLAEKVTRLQNKYGFFEPEHLPWRTIRDALIGLPDPTTTHSLTDHCFRAGARAYPGHTGSEIDWPSKTIKAGDHGVPGGENMIRFPDQSLRYLTVLETKRIQSFPDDFVIAGAWGEAMRQLGNAVPVQLAEVIGRQLMQVLQVTTQIPAINPSIQCHQTDF
jgi:DNA (cytosine-5)-methyltransferase 1